MPRAWSRLRPHARARARACVSACLRVCALAQGVRALVRQLGAAQLQLNIAPDVTLHRHGGSTAQHPEQEGASERGASSHQGAPAP